MSNDLANTCRAAIVTLFAYLLTVLYMVLASWISGSGLTTGHFFALLFGLALIPIVILAAIVVAHQSDQKQETRLVKIVVYVWSYVFLTYLTYLVWATGGLFESPFAWLFEVAIVATIQMTAFSKHSERWLGPLNLTFFIFLLYVCLRLWPDAPPELNNSHNLGVQWLHAIFVAVIILGIQRMVEIATNIDIEKHIKPYATKST